MVTLMSSAVRSPMARLWTLNIADDGLSKSAPPTLRDSETTSPPSEITASHSATDVHHHIAVGSRDI